MPRALVFYHYFHPDDVVSAQHYADLCKGLKERGWDVTVMPCNRGCRDETQRFPLREIWKGIDIRRIWRPAFRQSSMIGRLLNAAWMLAAWSLAALKHRPDVLIVGTDPVFAVLTAIPWKWLRPRTRIFHWCFDLHPEAAIADGMFTKDHPWVRMLRPLLRRAYRNCHLIGSIGPCMTRRLLEYSPDLPIETFTPWALLEPEAVLEPDSEERRTVFGEATLTLMYSGNFGRAHAFDGILALARKLREHGDIRFAFSVRGNRAQALRQAVTPEDTNISFVDFAPQDRLEHRLGAADIHIVSLRPDYAGTGVPSKFQGALAVGRPILYAGPADSAIAQWIAEYGLGWTLDSANLDLVVDALLQWKNDPAARKAVAERCFQTYHAQFSKHAIQDRLDESLRGLLRPGPLSSL